MQRYDAPKRIFLAFRQKLLASFTNPAQNASYLAGIGGFVEMETRPAAECGRKNSTRVSARVLPMCSTMDDYHDKI